MLSRAGTTAALACIRPIPFGAKIRLPLLFVVWIVLLAIATLLSTGPEAKI